MDAGDYLAKSQPPQTIRTHGIIAGTVAQLLTEYVLSEGTWQQLQQELGLSEQACTKLIGYIASLHDVGKLSKDVQDVLNGDGRTGQLSRHEKTTAFCLKKIWKECGDAALYANILGAHHQGKHGERAASNKEWQKYQQEFEQEMRQYFLKEENLYLPNVSKSYKPSVEAVLLGLVILADWISSSETFDDAEEWIKNGTAEADLQTKIIKFLTNSGLKRQEIDFGTSFYDIWSNIPKNGMRPLQREAEQLFEQTEERISLVLLEAPMGEGKTEAGLFCAIRMMQQWRKNGFYIGLPTAATSNQMVKRMRELLAMHDDTEHVKLLHAMAWMEDETTEKQPRIADSDDAQAAMRWMSPVRRGLLNAYAVGTVDQVMMSVMLIKYGVLRLLGLSGKVLVIDELHAYDMYMQTILETLLQWCRALEIPVILLSATLPPEKKQQMLSAYGAQKVKQEYPAITAVTESGRTVVYKISQTTCRHEMQFQCCPILGQQEQIAEKAVRLVEHGGCACILMNTVRQAQEVYQLLKAYTKEEILLFHARFPAERRDEIEKECVRLFGKDKTYRPKKAILVATQVVEQSLDLDFDVMLTAVAPIDLLLQRAGRVHRHADTVRPQNLCQPMIYVLTPDGAFEERDANCFVYPKCLLQRSIALLTPERTVRIPEDMEELVTAGYDSKHISPEELEQWLDMQLEQQIERGSGENMCLNPPDREFQPTKQSEKLRWDDAEQNQYLSAKTRLGEPSERIALVDAALYAEVSKAQKENCCRRVLARKVLKQSVSARSSVLRDFRQDDRIIKGTGLLFGVSIYPAEEQCYTGLEGQTIIFDPELGVLFQKREGEVCMHHFVF